MPKRMIIFVYFNLINNSYMKQLSHILLTTAILLIASVCVAQQIDYRKIGTPLPDLKVVDRSDIVYTKLDITENRNFFLVMFNPQCGHCVDAAKVFRNNKLLFDDNTVMFVTVAEMMEMLPAFAGEVDWIDGANMILGVDSAQVIADLFNYVAVPQVNIYDADYKLIKVLNGDIKLEDLQAYIR